MVNSSDLSPRELGAWRGMLRVHATLFRALDAELEAVHGLPLNAYEVLLFLAEAPQRRLRMSDLAGSLLLSQSGVTRLVDRLEQAGLVVRERCESDGRGTYAVLTPEGYERWSAARVTHLGGVRRLFVDRLSEGEQESLAEIWERVLEHVPEVTSRPSRPRSARGAPRP